ncbi:MAG: hypothetical protein KDB02_13185 [Acidimicrobiales bacterium]|nr:hypothetical protein [Acidimicrobiales bacterium]
MNRIVHPDRQGLASWLFGSLVLAVAVALGAAGSVTSTTNGQPASVGVLAGVVVTVLAMWGLPSVSLRLVVRMAVVTSGVAVARFGTVGPEITNGTQTILLWMLAAVAALVLAARVDHHAVPAAETIGAPPAADAGPGRPGRTAAHIVVVAAVVVAVVTVLAPYAVSRAGRTAAAGRGPASAPEAGSSLLRSSDSLDMTTRPDLTDDVVLTVRADQDLFLRGDVFDRWDGRRWTKSSTDRYALYEGNRVVPPPIDIGAVGSEVVEQTITVEAGYSDVYFATPSAVRIDSRLPVVQTIDGSLLTRRGAMGRGETYHVTSRRVPLTESLLRSVEGSPIPQVVTSVYAEEPVTTDRVRALADRIVAEAGADSIYDRVRALENWMDRNLEYSIDAPTSPKGTDVVDDFLFRSKIGWCEQIASSLVVMARAQGIPARLATGYVMDERDALTGTYVVRARNAHAWAEIWFPEVGWVPFDPTAGVPLAAGSHDEDTFADRILQHLVEVVVGVGVLVLVLVGGRRLLRRWMRRRADRPRTWAAAADRRLNEIGAKAGTPRHPGETATAYARRVQSGLRSANGPPGRSEAADGRPAEVLDLVAVGAVIDGHLYAPVPPGPERDAMADQVLDAASRTEHASGPSAPLESG